MATATRPDDLTRRRPLAHRLRLPVGVVLVLALLGLTGCDLPSGFHDYVVFDGLNRPTSVEFSSDGRIFVTEKRGVLKVFDGLDDTTATVVADLRTSTYNSWDRGMLGLALHPAFPAVPDVFVAYTRDALPGGTAPRWGRPGVDNDTCPTPPGETADGCVVGARISRLRLAGPVWDGVEHVLVEDWCQQFPSHSIGTLAFGADGALYAGAGDGAKLQLRRPRAARQPVRRPGARGRGAPIPGPADRRRSARPQRDDHPGRPCDGPGPAHQPAGRLPRRQRPARSWRRACGTPSGSPSGRGRTTCGWPTWAGARGRRSTAPGATTPRLDNFGWPCREGNGRTRDYDVLDLPVCEDLYAQGGTVRPVFTYEHGEVLDDERCPTDDGSSISGIAFAPADTPYPAEYRRALFFADATRGCIWAMGAGGDGLPDPTQVTWFDQGARTPVELEFGPGGELWYVDLFGGRIHRLGYSATNQAPQAAVVATPSSGDAPLTVSLDAGGSSDADPGDVLTYAWDTDGDGELDDGTERAVATTYDSPGTRSVRVRVTDAAGATDTATAIVRVGHRPARASDRRARRRAPPSPSAQPSRSRAAPPSRVSARCPSLP